MFLCVGGLSLSLSGTPHRPTVSALGPALFTWAHPGMPSHGTHFRGGGALPVENPSCGRGLGRGYTWPVHSRFIWSSCQGSVLFCLGVFGAEGHGAFPSAGLVYVPACPASVGRRYPALGANSGIVFEEEEEERASRSHVINRDQRHLHRFSETWVCC